MEKIKRIGGTVEDRNPVCDDYRQTIIDNCVAGGGFDQVRYDIEARICAYPALRLIRSIVPNGRALDLGCAYGTMSVWLKKLGWDVLALDKDELFVNREFLEMFEVDFLGIDIRYAPNWVIRFNLIVFTEVLEHLPFNPTELFANLYANLNPGGILVLSTPDLGIGYHPGKLQTAHYSDLPEKSDLPSNKHYYVYRMREIKELCEQAGFVLAALYSEGRHIYCRAVRSR